MTDEQINIAIAKALSYTDSKDYTYKGKTYTRHGVHSPSGYMLCFYDDRGNDYEQLGWKMCFQRKLLPDYVNDLNAMHEAEKVMISKGNQFRVKHYDNLNGSFGCTNTGMWAVYATASQRAEAFLKTLNLYNP